MQRFFVLRAVKEKETAITRIIIIHEGNSGTEGEGLGVGVDEGDAKTAYFNFSVVS